MLRKIVVIDEAKCDGCGDCLASCAEGAIALVGGKARLVSDAYCDGLGACLGECPQGAITVVEREAPAFDEGAVAAHLARLGRPAPPAHPAPEHRVHPAGPPPSACPGSAPRTLRRGLAVVSEPAAPAPGRTPVGGSALTHWPVQLALVPPHAPWLAGADLLVAADCVPFALATFHADLLAGRTLLVGCPKLDDQRAQADKLAAICTRNEVRSITVARMEVPCCGGIAMAVREGVARSGRAIAVRDVVIGVDGALRG